MLTEALQKAREYEAKFETYIATEERPGFHLTPRVGWMNDPNGFSVYQGQYHLFYQYHPYSTQWGPMHWGHAVSDDLLHWRYLPAAIAPDQCYDRGGCFSGSAMELPDGRQLLLYTGVRRLVREDGTMQDLQTQCVAVGDGLNYEKSENNPVLDWKDVPDGFSRTDFRDPKLWREPDGTYRCVVGNRTDDGSGAILLYESADGFTWDFVSVLDRCYNEYGKMWECPDFFSLDGKQVLLVSPQDMSPLGLEFHNGNGTLCLIGSVDSEARAFLRERLQAIDYGLDFYAPQTLQAPDGRRIMIGWMQNWDTCVPPAEARWFGQMSTPRELSLRDGRFIQVPVRELEALRGRRVLYSQVPVQEEVSLKGIYGRMVDMTVTLQPGDAGGYTLFRMKVAKGSQHYTSISYCPKSSTLRLSRTHAGFNRDFVHERECLVRNQGGILKLRIILDRFSVEIFANDGEQAMTATFYTPLTADGISFEAQGQLLLSVEKYELLP